MPSPRTVDPCLYDLLGVSVDATLPDIRIAYFRKSKELHPDKNPDVGSADEMQKLTEARNILVDPELRRLYNIRGYTVVAAHLSSSAKFKKERDRGVIQPFSSYHNVYVDYNLTLEDLYTGVERSVSYQVKVGCRECNDTVSMCGICGGSGFVVKEVEKGVQIFNADNGEAIVEKGFGSEVSGSYTDLIIIVSLEPHAQFQKFKDDILMNMNINLIEALFGFEKTFRYLDGEYYKVATRNSVISHRDQRAVKGMGLKCKNSFLRGDLVIVFEVSMPPGPLPATTVLQIASALPFSLNSEYDPTAAPVTMVFLS